MTYLSELEAAARAVVERYTATYGPWCVECHHAPGDPDGDHADFCTIGRLARAVEAMEAAREGEAKDTARFEWLTNMLDFDVKVSEADPCDWADENVSIADAWRKAIDHAMAVEQAAARATEEAKEEE